MPGSSPFACFRSALITLFVAGVLALGAQAQAAPTVEKDGNTATAIRNLVVNDVTYDVEFRWSSARDLYGQPPQGGQPDYDFTDSPSASAAVNAVIAVLNAETGIT